MKRRVDCEDVKTFNAASLSDDRNFRILSALFLFAAIDFSSEKNNNNNNNNNSNSNSVLVTVYK